MFDNLRDDVSEPFYEEGDSEIGPEGGGEEIGTESSPRQSNGKFLGMTSFQRFIVAVMLMVAVCTLGAMCLLLTGKIGLV